MTPSPAVLVALPGPIARTETFIAAHVAQLPYRTTLVGGLSPEINGRPVLRLSPFCPETIWHVARGWQAGIRGQRGPVWWLKQTAFLKLLKQLRPAAVLAEYGQTGVWMTRPCAITNTPLVVHFHGVDASQQAYLDEYAAAYRPMVAQAAAIITVSQPMKEALLALGSPPNRTHLSPCGVDTEAFSGGAPAAAAPHFLAVGRFVEKKSPHLTILAFLRGSEGCDAARLTMIGEGPLLGPCRDLVKALGAAEKVAFVGPQPPEDIRAALRSSRGFLQHSVRAADGDQEGTPVGILEAAATGLPVISTRHAGIPQAVVDGETGYLVAERDVAAMAARIGMLIEQAQLAGTLGAAARQHAVCYYSQADSIQRLATIIDAAISRQSLTPITWPPDR